jgi:hypothetical protein
MRGGQPSLSCTTLHGRLVERVHEPDDCPVKGRSEFALVAAGVSLSIPGFPACRQEWFGSKRRSVIPTICGPICRSVWWPHRRTGQIDRAACLGTNNPSFQAAGVSGAPPVAITLSRRRHYHLPPAAATNSAGRGIAAAHRTHDLAHRITNPACRRHGRRLPFFSAPAVAHL